MQPSSAHGSFSAASGRIADVEAQIAANQYRDGIILPEPEHADHFRRGLLMALLTIPIAAILAAVFGLNSPTAGAATAPFAIVIAFGFFARGSGRSPVAGRGFTAAAGIGLVTMAIAAAISYPYSLFLTYLYDGGTGGILSSGFARFFSTWVDANVMLILASIAVVTVVSVVIVWRKARAARAHTTVQR